MNFCPYFFSSGTYALNEICYCGLEIMDLKSQNSLKQTLHAHCKDILKSLCKNGGLKSFHFFVGKFNEIFMVFEPNGVIYR